MRKSELTQSSEEQQDHSSNQLLGVVILPDKDLKKQGYLEDVPHQQEEQQNDGLAEAPLRHVSTSTVPGALAVPGMSAIARNDESTSPSEGEEPNNSSQQRQQQQAATVTEVSAHLVDEVAEEERRTQMEMQKHALRMERERNRELESRIQEIESGAVVALPMDERSFLDEEYSQDAKRRKLMFIGLVLALALTVVIAVSVWATRNNDNSSGSGSTLEPSTEAPTFSPTPDAPWETVGASIKGASARNSFGFSVALSGDGAVVAGGSPGSSVDGNPGVGRVRVFTTRNNNDTATGSSSNVSWTQLGRDMTGANAFDDFGASTAISNDGQMLAVGAIAEPGLTGYVQVYSFDDTLSEWVQLGVDLLGQSANDWYGWSVAMSADGYTVAAGGPGRHNFESDYRGNKTGNVRVYRYNHNGSDWEILGQDINGTSVGAALGRSVALSADGSIVAAGADWHNNGSGQVRVFALDDATQGWIQLGNSLNGGSPPSGCGYSVSLSSNGTIVAISFPANDGSGGPQSGQVQVFQLDETGTSWDPLGQAIDGKAPNDFFGTSVALSNDGTILAASSAFSDGTAGRDIGHVRVFRYNSAMALWEQVGEAMMGPEASSSLGFSVSLSSDGARVAAGSPLTDSENGFGSGTVQVFAFPSR